VKLFGVVVGIFATGFPKTTFGSNKESKMIFPNESESRITPLSTKDMSPESLKILARLPGKGLQGEGEKASRTIYSAF